MTLAMGDFYGNDVGGGDGCDGHQVVDEAADMDVDKVVDMVLKIPDEGFADVSLKFDNTKKDNDRCGEW